MLRRNNKIDALKAMLTRETQNAELTATRKHFESREAYYEQFPEKRKNVNIEIRFFINNTGHKIWLRYDPLAVEYYGPKDATAAMIYTKVGTTCTGSTLVVDTVVYNDKFIKESNDHQTKIVHELILKSIVGYTDDITDPCVIEFMRTWGSSTLDVMKQAPYTIELIDIHQWVTARVPGFINAMRAASTDKEESNCKNNA